MLEVKEFIFYSNGHNGDIHYSREFIKDILKKLKVKASFEFNSSHKLLKDIDNLEFKNFNNFNLINEELSYNQNTKKLFINVWVGSSNAKHIQNEIGCSLTANYNKFKNIYNSLNLILENPNFYVPSVNWQIYDINQIDEFIKNNLFEKYILISNGSVLSGQSVNNSLNPVIEVLSNKFKNFAFILTDSKEKINKKNIFYTTDFIKTNGGDLNEIGYLGTKCDLIIGRGSGPFCFCHNKDCLLDDKKSFLAITNYKTDGLWALPEQLPTKQAKQFWTNNFDNNSICDIIIKIME